jgi:hypothetical protein
LIASTISSTFNTFPFSKITVFVSYIPRTYRRIINRNIRYNNSTKLYTKLFEFSNKGGFPKTSVFGKATLDLGEKAAHLDAFSRSLAQNRALLAHSQLVQTKDLMGQAQRINISKQWQNIYH